MVSPLMPYFSCLQHSKAQRSFIHLRTNRSTRKKMPLYRRKILSSAILFSRVDAEGVLKFELAGTYLLYRDFNTDHLYLSVRSNEFVEHHRINYEDNLYYMDNQPYPYLDSIILYHQRHKLNGIKLTYHAHLSARTVKAFTTKVMHQNGNVPHTDGEDLRHAHNEHIASREHTNDDVLTARISKSSGRLWISGKMQQSLKRISMPIPEVYHHLGDIDTRLTQSYRGADHLLSHADSFNDINGDIFDTKNSNRKHSEDTESDCSSVNIGNDVMQDDDIVGEKSFAGDDDDNLSVYDTHLFSCSSSETWICQNGFCYSLFTEHGGVSFQAASKWCRQSNSFLVSIHSEQEHQFVEKIRTELVGMPVWLGMRRFITQKTWVDETPVDFLPWGRNYHSAKNPDACIYSSGDWYEGNCGNNLYFICKRKGENENPTSPSKPINRITEGLSTSETIWTTSSDGPNPSPFKKSVEKKPTTADMTSSPAPPPTGILVSEGNLPNGGYQGKGHYFDRQQFEDKLKSLRVKKKKMGTKEAPGGQAIGAVAISILLLMFAGVILLDLNTFQQNWRMFRMNVSQMRE
uniref:Uncharacterized protein LOC111106011 n=1 Tax=Crassostrea virginica TaxID=6565 RepID=A0A8B8AYI6_CRAVI|nr:uncharacterized protein LOC111106011 [Crassostrea virginica]